LDLILLSFSIRPLISAFLSWKLKRTLIPVSMALNAAKTDITITGTIVILLSTAATDDVIIESNTVTKYNILILFLLRLSLSNLC
jgi:hypothetical protein